MQLHNPVGFQPSCTASSQSLRILENALYRLGEERDDTSKELVPPAPRPVQNKSSRLLDPAVEKKTVKGSKQAPANGKDQVFMMDRQFTFMPLLRDLGLWVLVSSDRYARELAACCCY